MWRSGPHRRIGVPDPPGRAPQTARCVQNAFWERLQTVGRDVGMRHIGKSNGSICYFVRQVYGFVVEPPPDAVLNRSQKAFLHANASSCYIDVQPVTHAAAVSSTSPRPYSSPRRSRYASTRTATFSCRLR